jgi:hypothetical protein
MDHPGVTLVIFRKCTICKHLPGGNVIEFEVQAKWIFNAAYKTMSRARLERFHTGIILYMKLYYPPGKLIVPGKMDIHSYPASHPFL